MAAEPVNLVPPVRGTWREHEPMASHTTWRCGGMARRYFAPADRDDLCEFLRHGAVDGPIVWLGLGSNMLVRDAGLDGTVIATHPGISALRWLDEQTLYAECGVPCAKLAREAATRDRAGLEFLSGIPGTLGGALRMNAGALGSEIWDFVEAVDCVTAGGDIVRYEAAAFTPRYRFLDGPADWFLGAWLRLPDSANGQGNARIRAALTKRNRAQPTGAATCGSVFKNPPGDYAGRLIESCGLKGLRVGAAAVSTKHANFIVNDDGATADDIETLIGMIRETVEQQTGVVLEAEVRIVGSRSQADGGEDQP